jgi:hypothetical protein
VPSRRPIAARETEEAGLLLIRLAVLTVLLGGLARSWADPDLWGHLRFGADIVRDGGLTRSDPYSFTSDIPWVNHEWLAEVLMYGAWAAGGGWLIALKVAIVAGTLGLLLLTLLGRQVSPTARDLAAVAMLLGLWARVFVIRPQLFSVVLFAALLWALSSAERGREGRLWTLPLLFGLWVNLHGGWIVGCGALLLWTAAALAGLGAARGSRGKLAGVLALSLAATLVNPYGVNLWAFLGETVRVNRPSISDWRPLWESDAQVILPWLITAGLTTLALARGRLRIPIAHTALVVGLGAASVRVSRLDVFFTLSAVMLLTPYLAAAAAPPPPLKWSRGTILAGAALACMLAVAASWIRADLTCLRMDGPWMPERDSGGYIAANRLQGRLLSWFDWGQYAIWHFSPALKVSLDGRRETVYSEAFVARHFRLYFEPETSMDLLAELRPDYAWIPRDLPLVGVLERTGWHRLYDGPISAILGRNPLPQPAAPVLAANACFPGP